VRPLATDTCSSRRRAGPEASYASLMSVWLIEPSPWALLLVSAPTPSLPFTSAVHVQYVGTKDQWRSVHSPFRAPPYSLTCIPTMLAFEDVRLPFALRACFRPVRPPSLDVPADDATPHVRLATCLGHLSGQGYRAYRGAANAPAGRAPQVHPAAAATAVVGSHPGPPPRLCSRRQSAIGPTSLLSRLLAT